MTVPTPEDLARSAALETRAVLAMKAERVRQLTEELRHKRLEREAEQRRDAFRVIDGGRDAS